MKRVLAVVMGIALLSLRGGPGAPVNPVAVV